MTKLHMALLEFWSSFEWQGEKIPAFPVGRVPENQPFPYITFEVIQGGFFGVSLPTTYVWCKQPSDGSYNVQAQRADILDQIAKAIPESGKMVRFDGGMVRLERNDTNFLSYYDEPNTDNTTEPVIGGRVSVSAHSYIY